MIDRTMPAAVGETLQDRYPLTCPSCGWEGSARPSMSMEFGMNSGHCKCPECSEFLHLQISECGRRMTARRFLEVHP